MNNQSFVMEKEQESLLVESEVTVESKNKKKKIYLVFLALALILVIIFTTLTLYFIFVQHSPGTLPRPNKLVLISVDGFRWDYVTNYASSLPNVQRLIQNGTHAKSMIPVFPSKTFPNHYTIVTGLYPESHGIVANTMYDPVFNATFSISDESAVSDARWWGGNPLWVTCEMQGLKSGMFFWPGSEAPILGVRPSLWVTYNESIPLSQRVDTILGWMDLPEALQPTLYAFYMEQVDYAGHSYGPNSTQVAQALSEVDSAIGRFLDGLEARNILDKVNILLVSDHGMTDISPERVILIDLCINLADVYVVDWSPILALIPNDPSNTQQIYESLSNCHPNLTVFLKAGTPSRFHYSNNRRITSIVGIADLGWSISNNYTLSNFPSYFSGGNHGYDPMIPDMQAVFIAHGPSIAPNEWMNTSVSNLDIYNLATYLLNIKAATNNGTLDLVDNIALNV